MDPSVCLSRDPKAWHAQVGSWLLKKEVVVDLVMNPELLWWAVVSGAVYS